LCIVTSAVIAQSPYAGMQTRPIKALSEQQMSGAAAVVLRVIRFGQRACCSIASDAQPEAPIKQSVLRWRRAQIGDALRPHRVDLLLREQSIPNG
jgi:hypothetical protein